MPAKRLKTIKPKLKRKPVANKHALSVRKIGIKNNSNSNKNNDNSFAGRAFHKKPTSRRLLLIIAFAVFSLLLFFHFTWSTNNKSVPQNQAVSKAPQRQPVRLMIPAIGVNAGIQYVGVTAKGEMEVPSNTVDVGWFKFGPSPGERGSAVIAGHFNGENGEAGVFTDLYKLKEGDKLYIQDGKGTSIAFVVQGSRIYNPGYADDVFSKNDGVHLNLITCDGVWDGAKKSYSKRLVVFADIMH